MNEPRKHHYVPAVYQRRFVNERGLLWVYDRAKKSFDERHPSVICCENDLYAVKPQGAPKDQRLESVALAQVDGDCATGVRTLLSPLAGLPGLYVRSLVALFVGLQYSRLPSMREYVTTIWGRGAKEMMRLMSVNEDRMQSAISQYESDTGDKIAVSAQTMVEAIQRDGVAIVVNEVPFLRSIFDTAKIVAETVVQASWQVIRAPAETGFVLCDAPVTVVPPWGVRQIGFHVPGVVTYVPLSRAACLRLSGPRRHSLRYREADSNTVDLINQNIAANSDRFIMGPEKQELETVVARSHCAASCGTPRATFRRHAQNDDGSYEIVTMNPRDYFYRTDGRTP